MRLWSLHPMYLDSQGLVACWRESLLAQAVLLGKTKGYTNHPQLERFKACPSPVKHISAYLHGLQQEAVVRGYNFNANLISHKPSTRLGKIEVTTGQIRYEREHLLQKLEHRSNDWLADNPLPLKPRAHPLFEIIPGKVAEWEIISK